MNSECDNCGKVWEDSEVSPISDLWERVEPGGIMPAGECPECGALAYPVQPAPATKRDEVALYARILAECPAGYVRDILRNIQADVTRAIANDFCVIDYAAFEEQQRMHKTEIAKLKDLETEYRTKIRDAHKELSYLSECFDRAQDIGDELCRAMGRFSQRRKAVQA